ncbi:MAG: cell division protein FtsA [Candidatus Wildermuthbacteria bacterium]|nr:cell division protein FtsA [Candidatus Wildermuthbacteria bacterium]
MQIVAGLDIGSSAIKMAVAKKKQDGDIEILGLAQESSAGVRKGSVVKPEETADKIFSLKQRLENVSSQKIRGALVNIGGSHIILTSSHGIIAVSRADGQISKEDVERVMAAAENFPLQSNNEVIDMFPKQFMIDGVGGTKEVVGMKGMRLEADVIAMCAFSPYVRNLTEAVLSADIEMLDMIPSPLMAAPTVLTPRQKELGVALVDLGAGTTSVSVFEEGDLLHAAVFPVGSENITNDIAIGLRTDYEIAERVKKEFGTLGNSGGKRLEKIDVPETGILSFSPKTLNHIIEARMKEIFVFVQKELKRIERQGALPAGVVFVGGGAKLPRLAEFAKKELKLPSRLGSPHGLATFETDPAFLGVMGLVAQGFAGGRGEEGVSFVGQGAVEKAKKIFKMFIP